MKPDESLLIVGASARAAAFSALRADLRPWCVDLFADADLVARCPARRLTGRYPEDFVTAMEHAPPGPLIYTGGLENYPRLVDRMASGRTLWGNPGEVLRRARDPKVLANAARTAGLPAPVLGLSHTRGRWLIKPKRGTGGAGIRFWEGDATTLGKGDYCQEFIPGVSVSAVYVAIGEASRLLGVTWQLVGDSHLHGPPFRYGGSIGPMPLSEAVEGKLQSLGTVLVARTDLVGLFGVDGVLNAGEFWPVELNPRYTASMEVLELATGLKSLDWHRRAFDTAYQPEAQATGTSATLVGKAILYADRDLTFPNERELPWLADLPHPGERIAAGHPILTLFASGADYLASYEALRERAATVYSWLYAKAV